MQKGDRYMEDFEEKLRGSDFSRYTDLKPRLAKRLFGSSDTSGKVSSSYISVSDDEAEYVTAAAGIFPAGTNDAKPFQ